MRQQASVLVLTDEVETRDWIASALSHEGILLVRAENEVDALRQLRTRPLDAIIVDVSSAAMDGATFRRAQLADAKLARIPYILLTRRFNCLTYCHMLGAIECLRKPFTAESIRGAVRKALV